MGFTKFCAALLSSCEAEIRDIPAHMLRQVSSELHVSLCLYSHILPKRTISVRLLYFFETSTPGFESGAISSLRLGDPTGCRPADAHPVCPVGWGSCQRREASASFQHANPAGRRQDASAGQLGPNGGPAAGLQTWGLLERIRQESRLLAHTVCGLLRRRVRFTLSRPWSGVLVWLPLSCSSLPPSRWCPSSCSAPPAGRFGTLPCNSSVSKLTQ